MSASSGSLPLRRTPLHELHLSLGAKMVAFAGYEMPVQYPTGIIKEHLHTRSAAGLFDVSHMGQAVLQGDDAAAALERLTCADVTGIKSGQMRYALLLSEDGCIKDDFMAARVAEQDALFLIVNAATKEADFTYIGTELSGVAKIIPQSTRALLALQGPLAEGVLSRHAVGVAELGFMRIAAREVAGVPAIVSRSGYTGEDGFEISLDAAHAGSVARTLLAEPEVRPVGLGARDSLRLEAGLCLYGHDIDESTSPVTAGLSWVIGKRRKMQGNFPAAERIMTELFEGTRRKRVGLRLADKVPAREGADIVEQTGATIGRVTSGGYSPCLGAPIAMGYIDADFAADGSEVGLIVREVRRPAIVVPLPFVPHRYKRSGK